MNYQTLMVEKRVKGVAWVTINNPPANAIGDDLMYELEHVAKVLKDDPSVRVIVITSAHPKSFLAGADLMGIIQSVDPQAMDDDPIAKLSTRMQTCFQTFATLPKPVIAAINGHALGGGCEFALACDFRIMSKGRIGLSELSLGIIPGAGGTQRMTRLLGRAKAIELIFTAKQLEPKKAEAIGLINRAVAPEQLESVTTEFAEQLAEGAIHAMGLAKRAINAAEYPMDEGLAIEAKAFSETFLTEEPSIGIAAFYQKEKAKFI
ncbi:enoyl-CoA hydratase/isomerase family protein [Robertmurraya kyonggiensis]|uniref:Enoyl-CoA hydratase/isomerase family protein n=1 Tax=Robertmurraya kyonggiensis TaxID=1037680 RepID=A0A4V5P2D0_9BACI|nr:enoyl-CoA hydratase/isomerase family protein [Robertmurraya kyonggiensis]TKC19540.1 enoyl-CoA hydratase/isomerase family protein [Robertmurraya kyonggiensis]